MFKWLKRMGNARQMLSFFGCAGCRAEHAQILDALGKLQATCNQILQGEKATMKELDDLTAEVARQTTVEKGALALIQGFSAQLAAAGTDPAKLEALAATLKANDDELASAILANTPAAPALA